MGTEVTKQFLYVDVCRHVATLIERGMFRVGERIPSVRRMSTLLRVSPATVFQAYAELERQGLVEARPQSGFYVKPGATESLPEPKLQPVEQTAVEVTMAELTERIIAAKRQPGIIELDTATPALELTPARLLSSDLGRAVRRSGPAAHAYCSPPGHLRLRQQLARRAVDAGCNLSPEDIIVTSGASEALHLGLRAVARAGDVIAVESPTYYGFLQLLESLGMKALEIPTSPRAGIDVDALRSALRRRRVAACFVMPNFHNPLGSVMSDERKEELVEVVTRAEVPLLEDDVAGDLFFGEQRPSAAKSFDRRGWVLLCSSVSKTVAPGHRVGWIAASRFARRVMQLQWSSTIAANTPGQLAVAEYLGTRAYDRHLRRLRATVYENVQRMSQLVATHFPTGTTVTPPEGGLVLWVEAPIDSARLHRDALAAGIAVMPGVLFSPRPTYRRFLRLGCAIAWSRPVERAIQELGRLCQAARET